MSKYIILDNNEKPTGEKLDSSQIEKILSTKQLDKNSIHTWYREKVQLKDGRKVVVTEIARNDEYEVD